MYGKKPSWFNMYFKYFINCYTDFIISVLNQSQQYTYIFPGGKNVTLFIKEGILTTYGLFSKQWEQSSIHNVIS